MTAHNGKEDMASCLDTNRSVTASCLDPGVKSEDQIETADDSIPTSLKYQNASPSRTRQTTPLVTVPRGQRRGLLGQCTLLAEAENPQAYPRRIKWLITSAISLAAVVAPMGSSIFFPSLSQVAEDLRTTSSVANMSIALYMLSMAIFPLWWSFFSERLGRRSMYLVSFALSIVFNILSAVSRSIAMLVAMRMLSGGAASSVMTIGAGTITDIWESRERGQAMGIFYLGLMLGPLVAPIAGGALAQQWGWRSTLWFMAIYSGVILLVLFLSLPETLAVRQTTMVLETEVRGERTGTDSDIADRDLSQASHWTGRSPAWWWGQTKMCLMEPLRIVLYLRFPVILLISYYASISFGSLFVLNISIQETFHKSPYNFSTFVVGLLYVANSLGYVAAGVVGGRWMDHVMQQQARKKNRYDRHGSLVYYPEDRMRENAWLAALLYPAALIWYGWTAEYGVHWIVPVIANFFFGLGSMLIFNIATTMLTEYTPHQASTAVAASNFLRNIFSATGALVASPALEAIGNGWVFTILGLVGGMSSIVILAISKNGPRWRESTQESIG